MLERIVRGWRRSKPIIVVSGLPRAGTSMMMQILRAGGIPVVTDGVRSADEDNPRGYLELESIKTLDRHATWLKPYRGKAVKIVSPLLPRMPDTETYKVIFMRRDIDELLASQRAMLDRLGQPRGPDDQEMRCKFEKHLAEVDAWLAVQAHVTHLDVGYADAVRTPAKTVATVSAFLGGNLDEGRMAAVVEGGLHRHRSQPGVDV